MKIDFLEFENFKGIKKKTLELDGKTTIIFGVNGVGKTSVLKAINILFAPIINKITSNRYKQTMNIEVDDIKFNESKSKIRMGFHLGKSTFEYYRGIERKSRTRTHIKAVLDDIGETFEKEFEIEDSINEEDNIASNKTDNYIKSIPIFVNYGIDRAVPVVSIHRIYNKHTFDRLSTFEKAIENKIDFRTFFEWFRNQQAFENQVKVDKDKNYVDKQLKCVKEAVLTMLDKKVFSDIKIMYNPLRMVATKDNNNIKIEQLSDGEKCTLAMIGDLARRLAIANPSLDNPLEGEGIVLIDEVELHLHPTWQARIIPTFRDTFPNIQFIITTHSPKVLGEISGDVNIFELERIENGVQIKKMPLLIGWDSNYILEEYMGTSSLNTEIKGKISQMFTLIGEKKFDEAQEYADELEKLTDDTNPNVISARMLIARGRASI